MSQRDWDSPETIKAHRTFYRSALKSLLSNDSGKLRDDWRQLIQESLAASDQTADTHEALRADCEALRRVMQKVTARRITFTAEQVREAEEDGIPFSEVVAEARQRLADRGRPQ
jgi:type IV secretory pathway VirB4 component